MDYSYFVSIRLCLDVRWKCRRERAGKARERQGGKIYLDEYVTPIALIRTAEDVWHVPVTITGQRPVDDWPDQGYLPDNVDGHLPDPDDRSGP